MGDVANILGVKAAAAVSAEDTLKLLVDGKPKPIKTKSSKPAGMARELYMLVGDTSLVQSVQPVKSVTPVYKTKRSNVAKGKWIWTSFTNSARSDGKEFYHWQRADLLQSDYPYAKFNIKTETIRYTDEEYNYMLVSPKFSRSETDYIMYICAKYDLRWPVITDRYSFLPARPTVELQERYFEVVTKLNALRSGSKDNVSTSSNALAAGSGSAGSTADGTVVKFDASHERARRKLQEGLLLDSAAGHENPEVDAILADLNAVNTSLKSLGHDSTADDVKVVVKRENSESVAMAECKVELFAAHESDALISNSLSSQFKTSDNNEDEDDDESDSVEEYLTETTPVLQSTRLVSSEINTKLSEILLKKMTLLLTELGVTPDILLPTKSVCDLYDLLRVDCVALLSLKAELFKVERELSLLSQSVKGNESMLDDSGKKNETIANELNIPASVFLLKKFPLPAVDAIPKPVTVSINTSNSNSGSANQASLVDASGVADAASFKAKYKRDNRDKGKGTVAEENADKKKVVVGVKPNRSHKRKISDVFPSDGVDPDVFEEGLGEDGSVSATTTNANSISGNISTGGSHIASKKAATTSATTSSQSSAQLTSMDLTDPSKAPKKKRVKDKSES